jgi:type I restriction enzyme S subunit
MDTKALRQKILDLAIRGKLVPQDPNDEPASVLLERIREEKQQMLKEGKLKPKDLKNDTIIFRGEDNLHYEKFRDGSVKCIEDEIPFEVPMGWEWCRIKNISIIGTGATPLKNNPDYYQNGTIPWITSTATSTDFIKDSTNYITNLAVKETNCTLYPIGTLVIAMYGEGKTRGQISELGIEACTNQACATLQVLGNSEYLKQFVKTYFQYNYNNLRQKAKGGQQPNLNQTIIANTIIPIPAQKEMKQMIVSLSKYICIIDSIDENKSGILTSIKHAKKCILDIAIRGKLVPQNPDDEPASILLERIRLEKEKLIKQGKIKRDKKESIIFKGDDNSYYRDDENAIIDISDELPFIIPDSWCWGKLKDIVIINPRNKLSDDTEVSFIPMPLIEDGYSGRHTSETRKWEEVKVGFTHFKEGDIGIAKITPCFENKKSTIFKNLCNGYGAGTTELHVLRPYKDTILPEYLLVYVKTNQFIENGKQTFSGAVGQQRIRKAYVENTYFPIPPIKEQYRIVKQLEDLFSYLSTMENALLSV